MFFFFSFQSQQWNERLSQRNSPHLLHELAVAGDENKLKESYRHYDNIDSEEKLINSDPPDVNKTENDCSNSFCSYKSNFDNDNASITNIWNIGHSSSASDTSVKQDIGVSYSQASTVPLVNSPVLKEIITPSNTSSASSIALTTGSLQDEPVQFQFSTNGGAIVTSYVKIPIVKSSSAPDSKSENSVMSFRTSLDSFNLASPSTSTAFQDSPENCLDSNKKKHENNYDEGVETLTRENIICPSCNTIFPPKMHIEFLDHYESCQRTNS